MVLQLTNNSAISRAQTRLLNNTFLKKDYNAIFTAEETAPGNTHLVVGYNGNTNHFEVIGKNKNVLVDTGLSWEYSLITKFSTNCSIKQFRKQLLNRIVVSSSALLSDDNLKIQKSLMNGDISLCDLTDAKIIELVKVRQNEIGMLANDPGYTNFYNWLNQTLRNCKDSLLKNKIEKASPYLMIAKHRVESMYAAIAQLNIL